MKRKLLLVLTAGILGFAFLPVQPSLNASDPIYMYSVSPKGEHCQGDCEYWCCKIELVPPPIKPTKPG